MISSKQRSFLRSMANGLQATFQVGKAGVTPEFCKSIDEALEAGELIKLSVLDNCPQEPKEVAELLSGRTRSSVVQVIGRKVVIFRQNTKKPTIELPKSKK